MPSYKSKGTLSVYLLLSAPRCGSQLLTDFLNSHPDITAIHEPFQELRNSSDPIAYLKSLSPNTVVGVRYNQFVPELEDYPIIHLVRGNKELLAASQILAGSWEIVNKLVTLPIEFSAGEFYERVDACRMEEELWSGGRSREHTVSYEQMTGGKETDRFFSEEDRKELLHFIGVPDMELLSSRRKEHSAHLGSLIRLVA